MVRDRQNNLMCIDRITVDGEMHALVWVTVPGGKSVDFGVRTKEEMP